MVNGAQTQAPPRRRVDVLVIIAVWRLRVRAFARALLECFALIVGMAVRLFVCLTHVCVCVYAQIT